jgi:cell wall-associated NlpC family hydrolase
MIKLLISYAMSFLGAFYSWGGNGPSYDCSGLISEILRAAGLVKEGYRNSAMGMYLDFKDRWQELDTPLPGAIIFYADSKGLINHVAYAVDERMIVEAAGGGSKTKTEEDAIRDRAFVRLRNYDYRLPYKVFLPNYKLYKES